MRFKLNTLTLQFQRSIEVIDLTASITFFHGKISSGKSTILHMVDACLGGKLPRNTAILQEFVSARLDAQIGEYLVIFERLANSNQVQVSWLDPNENGASVLAPIDNADSPIWKDNVFGLSDLIFELAGVGPMKVRRNKTHPNAPLIPLSFRDVMWYCYLDQDELDSTFFHLESDDPRMPKSRDVVRFVLGYYTERLNELEQQLAFEVEEAKTKRESAERLRRFLGELGYESALEIAAAVEATQIQIATSEEELRQLRESHATATHFTDDLKQRLRELSREIEQLQAASSSLDEFIVQEKGLRAELLSTKFRLKRLGTATSLMSDVEFSNCPRCGTPVADLNHAQDECTLCGAPDSAERRIPASAASPDQTDLDARLVELDQSISIRMKERVRQSRTLDQALTRKATLDDRLNTELRTYDSAFLSQARALERKIATLQQELIGLKRDARIPEALAQMEREADQHGLNASRIRRSLSEEKEKLSGQSILIEKLEGYFYEALHEAGFPSLVTSDAVFINRRSWLAYIQPGGDEALQYNFFGAGSGGKKTLFNVCYAVAFHRLAEEYNLPLPTFLMIDSPMKNIGNDVNKDIFLALYRYVYTLKRDSLSETQLVIADTDIATPPAGSSFRARLMIAGNSENPPLIPYYSGH
jgi:rubrerythrin